MKDAPKNFAIIGVAGYVAPRHLEAIKSTSNNLVVGLDPSDSVGVLDHYFPKAAFFTEFERFDRHVDKLRRTAETKVDYISICSPNYLHDSHCRFALRSKADVICEKPLVLNPWNLDGLEIMEREFQKSVNTILQLRLHPTILKIKNAIGEAASGKRYSIDLSYVTPRGAWYKYSWKGNEGKSGGVATNIGIHFFDMLCWIFGECESSVVNISNEQTCAGFLQLKNADVRWLLSTDQKYLPHENQLSFKPFRSIIIDEEVVEFSDGFKDLHTSSYENILSGSGFRPSDARASIELIHRIRNQSPVGLIGEYHPILKAL